MFIPSLDTIKRRLGVHRKGKEIVAIHETVCAFYNLPLAAKEKLTSVEAKELIKQYYSVISRIPGDKDLIAAAANATLETHWINAPIIPKRGRGKPKL